MTRIAQTMTKNGISLEHVEVGRNHFEVMIPDGRDDGRCDYDDSVRLAERIVEILGWGEWYSRSTGYGSVIVRKGRESIESELARMNID